jgi:hypothetical protein
MCEQELTVQSGHLQSIIAFFNIGQGKKAAKAVRAISAKKVQQKTKARIAHEPEKEKAKKDDDTKRKGVRIDLDNGPDKLDEEFEKY